MLGAAKAEFQKYGQVWDRLGKQLQTAQNTVTAAGQRTRAIERKLRDVELVELPSAEVSPVLEALISGVDETSLEIAEPADDAFAADIDPEIRSI